MKYKAIMMLPLAITLYGCASQNRQIESPTNTQQKITTTSLYYSVNKTDTLYKIAREFGTTEKNIITLNDMRPPFVLVPGSRIKIKQGDFLSAWHKPSISHKKLNNNIKNINTYEQTRHKIVPHIRHDNKNINIKHSKVYASNNRFYKIKKGDTLIKIARHYHVRIHDLMKWNGIKDANKIRANDKIRISNHVSHRHNAVSIKHKKLVKFSNSCSWPTSNSSGIMHWYWPLHQCFSSADMHNGATIKAKSGSFIVAAASGRVIYIGQSPTDNGEMIIIKHRYNYTSSYINLTNILVRSGQYVNANQKIGRLKGNNLGFEIRLESPSSKLFKLQKLTGIYNV